VNRQVPVLVGVGTISQRREDPKEAKEALTLMIEAAFLAGADAQSPAILSMTDRVYTPQGRWRYRDAAGAVALAVGARNATTVHAKVGVLQQTLIGDACERIAEGEIDVALVVGGEAGYRLLRSSITGLQVEDTSVTGTSDVVMRPEQEIALDVERESGLGAMAVGYYAIMESAFRAFRGWGVDQHRDILAALLSRFGDVAVTNPDAWNATRLDEILIRDASDRNRMLAFPYTKRHASSWSVDQAAAMLFCSAKRADELQIPRSKWIFPLASSESNHMVPVSARAQLHSCPGARIAGAAALEAAKIEVSELDLLDLYSCFPVAVEIVANELQIDMTRDLTVTGGMPFAGGPFNNYVLQTSCRMARLLRERPGSSGLVSSISGMLTKQGFGIWSACSGRSSFARLDVTSDVAAQQETKRVVHDYEGEGTIAGYTVIHEPDPIRAIAVLDVANGNRTVAFSEDKGICLQMERQEFAGRTVRIASGRFGLG
jgi:acetyl-CoA C-acetyltransferase